MKRLTETQYLALAAAERAPLVCFHAGWRHEEVHRRADLRAFTTHTIRSLLTRGFLREAKGRGPRPRKVVITRDGRVARAEADRR